MTGTLSLCSPVVGKSDLVNGVLSKNYQLTEMRQDNTVMTDPAPDMPDSSMDPIIISETQLEPRSIPESQLDISINDYSALIQNGNITSTHERSASPVSRTVTPLVGARTIWPSDDLARTIWPRMVWPGRFGHFF